VRKAGRYLRFVQRRPLEPGGTPYSKVAPQGLRPKSPPRQLFLAITRRGAGLGLLGIWAVNVPADEWKARHSVYSVNGNSGPSPGDAGVRKAQASGNTRSADNPHSRHATTESSRCSPPAPASSKSHPAVALSPRRRRSCQCRYRCRAHRHDDLHSRTPQGARQKPEFAAEPLRPRGHRPNTETP